MTKGERIKGLREQIGITQTELAEAINTTKQNIYKYENNIITNIPSDRIESLAKVLHTTPSYLMGWDEEQQRRHVLTSLTLSKYLEFIGYPFESNADDTGDWIRDKEHGKSYLVDDADVSDFEKIIVSYVKYQVAELMKKAKRIENSLDCF